MYDLEATQSSSERGHQAPIGCRVRIVLLFGVRRVVSKEGPLSIFKSLGQFALQAHENGLQRYGRNIKDQDFDSATTVA